MKKISLSEVEVNDLIDLYQSEIDRAQRRISNLKNIIKKISDGKSVDLPEDKPVKVASKRGRKPKAKAPILKVEKEIISEPKKRGRKPKVKEVLVKDAPKKRGRKPKTKPVAASTDKVATKKITKKVSKKKVAKEKPAKIEPKKRGPKPKVKASDAIEKPTIKKDSAKEQKSKETNLKGKVVPKKRGRKPKAIETKAVETKVEVKAEEKKSKPKVSKKKIVKAEPKKRGRKPKSLRKPIKGGKGKDKVKWNDFIFESLSSKNTLLPASAITQAAIEKFEIHESDRDRVRMAISTTLTKMAKKDKVLKTYSQQGARGSLFGLSTWFTENELKEEFKKNLK